MERRFRAVFALLSLWLLVAFFAFRDLPMVDLPQHASQIYLWQSWPNVFSGDAHFFLNLRTPYLVAYALARLLAPLIGLIAALKFLAWFAVVANALALTALVKKLGHRRWLGLLGFPTALCHSFYFGFFSFLFACPLAIYCWVLALSYLEDQSWKRAIKLGLMLCATLAAHGIAFCIAVVGTKLLLLGGSGTLWRRLRPLLIPAALIVVWLLPGEATRPIGPTNWLPVWDQILDLPASLVGMYRGDSVATVGGLVALGLVLLNVGKLLRAPWRLLLLFGTVAGYWFFPPTFMGLSWFHARFVGFVIPALLVACAPLGVQGRGTPRPYKMLRHPLCVVLGVTAWLCVFTFRSAAFNRETADFHRVVDQLPAGLTVRPIVFERESQAFPTVPALLHLPAYYQAEKGGFQGYSFAIYPSSVVRLREPYTLPVIPPGAEWHPSAFDAQAEAPLYDCFIVHSHTDVTNDLFSASPIPITLCAHEGSWWAYRQGTCNSAPLPH